MDPLITWQQNRPGRSDSMPVAEPQPAWLAFVNTFLPWEPAAPPWGPVVPPGVLGRLGWPIPVVLPAGDAAPAPSL